MIAHHPSQPYSTHLMHTTYLVDPASVALGWRRCHSSFVMPSPLVERNSVILAFNSSTVISFLPVRSNDPQTHEPEWDHLEVQLLLESVHISHRCPKTFDKILLHLRICPHWGTIRPFVWGWIESQWSDSSSFRYEVEAVFRSSLEDLAGHGGEY